MTPRRIGISLGNIDRFVDGLGEFARQFGLSLAARAPALREHGAELCFHTVPALRGCFGDDVGYVDVHRSQEWWHRQPQHFEIWHVLNQLIRYPAPHGTARGMVTVHDLNFVHVKSGYSRWRDTRRTRRLLARNDTVITISDHVATDLRQHLGFDRATTTIYNGSRDLSGAPQQAVPGLDGRPFLFHISRMAPSKNVEALLAMVAAWPEKTLVLAGPSAARNAELQAMGAALGLQQRLQVLTLVNDAQKAWLYTHCEAFAFPSLTEGMGLPPIEAMHFGKPVFLSDRTSLPEIGGDAAFYWHDFDPASMRRVVEQGLADFGPAQAARARANAARFDWNRTGDAYMQAYLQQLAR